MTKPEHQHMHRMIADFVRAAADDAGALDVPDGDYVFEVVLKPAASDASGVRAAGSDLALAKATAKASATGGTGGVSIESVSWCRNCS